MRRWVIIAVVLCVVLLAGCPQRDRVTQIKPPPAGADFEVTVRTVIVGDSPGWTAGRIQRSFNYMTPALASAGIVPEFLPVTREPGTDNIVLGSEEERKLQIDAYMARSSVLLIHLSETISRDGKFYGGLARLPWGAPISRNSVYVSAGSLDSTMAHEVGHHLGLLHADEDGGVGPPVGPVCVDKTICHDPPCSDNAMSYCGRVRKGAFTEQQIQRMRYWASVRGSFRAVSESAMAMLVKPEYTDDTEPTLCLP